MPGGFTQPGQRETIVRGERTDPRAVLGQAAALALCGTFIVLIVMAFWMLNAKTTWKWIGENWRWLAIFPVIPWIFAAVGAGIMLFVEIFDPNWPNPRDATPSTTPNFPWSKERMQPKGGTSRIKLTDLLNALDLEMESDDGDELD